MTMLAFFAVLFYLTFYLQGVRGNEPVEAAVALLPLTVVFTVSSPLAGWLIAKLGVRGTLLLGVARSSTAALLLLLRLDVDSGVLTLAPSLVLAGFGVGFLMVPAMQADPGHRPGRQGRRRVRHPPVGAAVRRHARRGGVRQHPRRVRRGRIGQVGAGRPAGGRHRSAAGLATGLVAGRRRRGPPALPRRDAPVFLIGPGIAVVAGVLALFVEPEPARRPDPAAEVAEARSRPRLADAGATLRKLAYPAAGTGQLAESCAAGGPGGGGLA